MTPFEQTAAIREAVEMSGAINAPKFKLIEIGTCFAGEEGTDYLVVEDSVKASDVLAGLDGISAQAADKLTGEIIVKSLNCYPKMVEALEEARAGLAAWTGGDDGACGDTIAKIDAALSLAKGDQK